MTAQATGSRRIGTDSGRKHLCRTEFTPSSLHSSLSFAAVIKFFFGSSSDPALPVSNSYWVEPGRLLAGEYPGATLGEKPERLRQLLAAGFNSFIDLTAEDELPPYHLEFQGTDVVHRRFAIVDHGIPDSPRTMRAIVAAITQDLADGRRVYLHCRAGIGRTGTAVGCYLISQGLEGPAALQKLQTLWQRCSRARSWPSVPETEEQVRFVEQWTPLAEAIHGNLDRAHGALLGLAIGEGMAIAMRNSSDAAWATVSQNVERLRTGADTAMTVAVAESLLQHGAHDPRDQLQRYLAWSKEPAGQALVPPELKRVLAVWQWSRKAQPGSHDPKNLDPHVLARTAAPVLFCRGDVQRAADLAAEVSRTTLQSPLVLDACRLWAATLAVALSGAAKPAVLTLHAGRAELQRRQVKPQINALLQGQWQAQEWPPGALRVVAGALETFRVTQSFDTAIRESMRAEDTSLAALVGSLAGAFYGASAMPGEWLRALPQRDQLEALAARLVQ